MVCQPCCFCSYTKASHPGQFKRQRRKTLHLCQEAKEEGRRHQVPTVSYVPHNPRLPTQPHFLHAPPLSHSSTLGSKSLPHSPSGTSYSTSSLVRINLHVGFHSTCGELFQLLNIHLLQHNLEYLNSTMDFILAGDRVTSGMIYTFLSPSFFPYPY